MATSKRGPGAGVTMCSVRRGIVGLFGLIAIEGAFAGATTDGTLGAVTTFSGNMLVPASVGRQVGRNLFHSFSTFNIGSGESLYFTSLGSSGAIGNVLTRVTGGSASSINGVLGSQITGANVYLMNPAGIAFGPNAVLDVSGSFYATTANYVKLADGGVFNAAPTAATVLTTADPVAFGFLTRSVAPITVSGSDLRVPGGQTLSLVGGDITVNGPTREEALAGRASLTAPGGRVDLVSAGSPGEAPVSFAEPAGSSILSGFQALGRVTLANNAALDVGAPVVGRIAIRSGALVIDNGGLFAFGAANAPGMGIDVRVRDAAVLKNNSGMLVSASVDGRSGDVLVESGSLRIESGSAIFALGAGNAAAGAIRVSASDTFVITTGAGETTSRIASVTNGSADGNEVVISGRTVEITDGASITTRTAGSGRAADLRIDARDSVLITGFNQIPSQVGSTARDVGDAGRVTITAPFVSITSDGEIDSLTQAAGRAGDVEIQARRLDLAGGRVGATTFGSGSGGNIIVTASESVTIAGRGPQGGLLAGLESDTDDTGNAGTIRVTTPVLEMNDGKISVLSSGAGPAGNIDLRVGRMSVAGGAQVQTRAFGTGNGGTIVVTASDSVTVSGRGPPPFGFVSGFFSETRPGSPANAGQIRIAAPRVTVSDDAEIGTSTLGSGRAGDIALDVGRLTLSTGGRISSDTLSSGRGGTVVINARESVTLAGNAESQSTFISTDTSGTGDAGMISVTAPVVEVNRAFIEGVSSVAGRAGDIDLRVGRLSLLGGGRVLTRTAGSGAAGNVAVRASEAVVISGTNNEGVTSDILTDTVDPFGPVTGAGGRITITTPRLTIADEGGIGSGTRGSGPGGDIDITAGRLEMNGGAQISARSRASGTAGNIAIRGDTFDARGGSSVITEAASADGGNISFHLTTLLHLRDSAISTSVGTGRGNGGNILIDPQFVVLNRGRIVANAFGGNGGNINIFADQILRSPESVIDASSALGVSGTISVSSPTADLTSSVTVLPAAFLNANTLLADRCAARLAGKESSLVLAGRGSLPKSPDELVPLDLRPSAPAGFAWNEPQRVSLWTIAACAK